MFVLFPFVFSFIDEQIEMVLKNLKENGSDGLKILQGLLYSIMNSLLPFIEIISPTYSLIICVLVIFQLDGSELGELKRLGEELSKGILSVDGSGWEGLDEEEVSVCRLAVFLIGICFGGC